jgi:hypothetical protein
MCSQKMNILLPISKLQRLLIGKKFLTIFNRHNNYIEVLKEVKNQTLDIKKDP